RERAGAGGGEREACGDERLDATGGREGQRMAALLGRPAREGRAYASRELGVPLATGRRNLAGVAAKRSEPRRIERARLVGVELLPVAEADLCKRRHHVERQPARGGDALGERAAAGERRGRDGADRRGVARGQRA